MKKLLIAIAILAAIPSSVSAIAVSWDRTSVGRINPLYVLDTVFGNKFTATSTTQASIFPYASTTAISSSNLSSGNCLQASTGGLITSVAFPCGSGTGSVTQINTNSPITGGPITTTGTIDCPTCLTSGFRDWLVTGSPAYLTPTSTLQSIGVFASSTIGSGTQAGGLTIAGGATTTGNSYFGGGQITLPVDTNFVLTGGVNGVSFDTNVLSVDATNNRVGIGTAAPTQSLDVQGGYVNVDQYSGYKQAGNTVWYASSTNNITAGGYQAAQAAIDGFSAGGSITAFGWNALGSASLSGVSNTGVGDRALAVNTTGTRNNAIGGLSLAANTTGVDNNAQGYQAGQGLTTGSQNTFFGTAAGGVTPTTVTDMTAIGYVAGAFNNSTSSVSIGSFAGRGTSGQSASQNHVNIGYRAGFSNTTGNANVYLGYQAADANTTGGGNIIVGNDIDTPAATTANYMSLGNTIFARNVSQTGSTADADATVGLGTTTPVNRLDIAGDIGFFDTIPALSACGTGPAITVGSTDTAGEITEGTISTGCVITFSNAKTNAPFCTVTGKAGLVFTYAVSTAAITITNVGALSSTALVYHCLQNNN